MAEKGSLPTMQKPSSVAVLPFPLTAGALLSQGILRFLGYISDNTHTRFTRVSSPHTQLLGCEGRIINLNCRELYPKMLELVKSDPQLKRILNFAIFGGYRQTRVAHAQLVSALQKLDTNASRQALASASVLVRILREGHLDIWQSTQVFEGFVAVLESLVVTPTKVIYPRDKRVLSLPVFQAKTGIPTDDDVTGSFEVELSEGRICELQGRHISLVIGGPNGSGKSTLAVSLVAEMNNIIRSLRSRQSFSNLQVSVSLSVGLADLDMATPTTSVILEDREDKRERLLALKRPWTMELAEEAQQKLLLERARHNIVIGDLPGRVTNITELLAGSADAGIIVSRDWEILKAEWVPLLASAGLPLVSRIRSRGAEGGFSSLVTHWRPGERLSGRITSLNRFQKSWDLFIQWLALFLLFDILPTQFEMGS
ncbi:hypothetical protein EPO17_00330 [Patescibacteria group bacterium]|nr:MAG: hypothetical protein EPO17_00330 [Patescibacteria group bacterium]